MKLSQIYVGTLKAGQPDIEGWKEADNLSQIHDDGSIYFYEAGSMTLEEFKILAEVAFEADAVDAVVWDKSCNKYRVDF